MKEYKFKINGNEYNVAINSTEGNIADVTVNGIAYQVEMDNVLPAAPVQAAPVQAAPSVQPAAARAAAPKPAAPAGAGKAVTAPMPGVILEISVKEGDTVSAGQKVAVLEALKMENEIQAESAGTVTKIHVAKGDSVSDGTPIVTIASADNEPEYQQSPAILGIHRILQYDMAASRDDCHRYRVHNTCHQERMGTSSSSTYRIRHDHRQHPDVPGTEHRCL